MRAPSWSVWIASVGAAAAALALAFVVGGFALVESRSTRSSVAAAAPANGSAFVAITPCRGLDTRPQTVVGSRNVPLRASESYLLTITGGPCPVDAAATAIVANVTIANPTSDSYLTMYPGDVTVPPLTSNLNWLDGAAPTANQVTVGLSADGFVNFYNQAGTVDVMLDIVGYFVPIQLP